jgi:signal transduction histidine kinase
MRERTALLGGTFEVASSGGRFRVRATLPYLAERRDR